MTNTTVNDILTRLRNGEDVETIAAQLTKDINEANNKYQAEVEAKRKAEVEAKRKAAEAEVLRNDKIQAVDNLLDAIVDLLAVYEMDSAILDAIEDIDPGQIVDAIDEALTAVQEEYAELVNTVDTLREKCSPAPKQGSTGDPIEQFLNKFVRS